MVSTLLFVFFYFLKMMLNENFSSIDDMIKEAASTLDDDQPIGSFDDVHEKIEEIQIVEADFSALDNLESLLLYCEDIANQIPTASEHSLYHNIFVDLKKKVDDYEQFFKRYEKNSYKVLTSKQCIKYAQWLSNKIVDLEQKLST